MQWIRGYRDVINAAAMRFDIPPVLLAGIAHVEIGGDPPVRDLIAWISARNLPFGSGEWLIGEPAEDISVDPMSITVRGALQALGYTEFGQPVNLDSIPIQTVWRSLRDPRLNIFITAKLLSDLRDAHDDRLKGKSAEDLTEDNMRVIAARFNSYNSNNYVTYDDALDTTTADGTPEGPGALYGNSVAVRIKKYYLEGLLQGVENDPRFEYRL